MPPFVSQDDKVETLLISPTLTRGNCIPLVIYMMKKVLMM